MNRPDDAESALALPPAVCTVAAEGAAPGVLHLVLHPCDSWSDCLRTLDDALRHVSKAKHLKSVVFSCAEDDSRVLHGCAGAQPPGPRTAAAIAGYMRAIRQLHCRTALLLPARHKGGTAENDHHHLLHEGLFAFALSVDCCYAPGVSAARFSAAAISSTSFLFAGCGERWAQAFVAGVCNSCAMADGGIPTNVLVKLGLLTVCVDSTTGADIAAREAETCKLIAANGETVPFFSDVARLLFGAQPGLPCKIYPGVSTADTMLGSEGGGGLADRAMQLADVVEAYVRRNGWMPAKAILRSAEGPQAIVLQAKQLGRAAGGSVGDGAGGGDTNGNHHWTASDVDNFVATAAAVSTLRDLASAAGVLKAATEAPPGAEAQGPQRPQPSDGFWEWPIGPGSASTGPVTVVKRQWQITSAFDNGTETAESSTAGKVDGDSRWKSRVAGATVFRFQTARAPKETSLVLDFFVPGFRGGIPWTGVSRGVTHFLETLAERVAGPTQVLISFTATHHALVPQDCEEDAVQLDISGSFQEQLHAWLGLLSTLSTLFAESCGLIRTCCLVNNFDKTVPAHWRRFQFDLGCCCTARAAMLPRKTSTPKNRAQSAWKLCTADDDQSAGWEAVSALGAAHWTHSLLGGSFLERLLVPGPKATISLQYFTSRGLFRDHLVDLDELINHQGALLPPRTNCVHKGRNIPSVRETEEDVLPDRGLFLRLLTGSHVGVALVTIDRPSKANSYDARVLRKLETVVDECHHSAVRVVVFRSSNPRFFCAGADRGRIANPQLRDGLYLESQRVFRKLADASFISVAVVEGACCAGGFEWALACDFRVAGPRASFWFPEPTLGLMPAAGGCSRLTALVGPARAKQIILAGDRLSPSTALAWGIVQYAADADSQPSSKGSALNIALDLAQKLLRQQATALQLAKQTIDRAAASSGLDGSLFRERVGEGALYQLKHVPHATFAGTLFQKIGDGPLLETAVALVKKILDISDMPRSRIGYLTFFVDKQHEQNAQLTCETSLAEKLALPADTHFETTASHGSLAAVHKAAEWCGHQAHLDRLAIVLAYTGEALAATVLTCRAHSSDLGRLPLSLDPRNSAENVLSQRTVTVAGFRRARRLSTDRWTSSDMSDLVRSVLSSQRLKPWQVARWMVHVAASKRVDDTNLASETEPRLFEESTPRARLRSVVSVLKLESSQLSSNVAARGTLASGGHSAVATVARCLSRHAMPKPGSTKPAEGVDYFVLVDLSEADVGDITCMLIEVASPPVRAHCQRGWIGRL